MTTWTLYETYMDSIWATWETDTHVALGIQASYTPDATDVYVSDLSAHEVTATGYTRHTLTGEARTYTAYGNAYEYEVDAAFDFGTPDAGQRIEYVVVAKVGEYGDIDSPVMCCLTLGADTDGTAFTVTPYGLQVMSLVGDSANYWG